MSTAVAAPHGERCVNCGAARTGPFCASCGQRARAGRLTLWHVARQVAADLSPVDHGIVFTALAVLRRPGRMAREYVDGVTVRYVGPVKYFLLVVGAAQILALRSGLLGEIVSGLMEGYFQHQVPTGAQARALDFVTRYFVSLGAIAVPLFAAWTRLLFRRARLHYAEHVVLALYTGAQHIALFTLVTGLTANRYKWLQGVYLLVAIGYEAWALHEFTGVSRVQAAWRTLAASILTVLGGFLLLTLLIVQLGHAA